MRRAAALIVLAIALSACGPDQTSIRMRAELGRELVYEARRVDDFADPDFGHGGVLETAVRFRLSTTDAVSDRGGKYETLVEAVRVVSAPRFGIRIDTDTPEPEGDDPLGVEDLTRGLLKRHGELTIHENGGFGEVRPDEDIRDELKRWTELGDAADRDAADGDARRQRLRIAALLDQMVDGPRVVLRTLQSPALLLPAEPYPVDGASWMRTAPTPSPAGLLTCDIDVTHARSGDGVVTLTGAGSFVCAEPLPDAPLTFVSGTLTASARFDSARGVFLDYQEKSAMTFAKVEGGEEIVATWSRELTLVE